MLSLILSISINYKKRIIMTVLENELDIDKILEKSEIVEKVLNKMDELERRIARLEIRLNLPKLEKLKRKLKGQPLIQSIKMDDNHTDCE